MRKRWLSLLLALVMLASVTVTTASADTVNLSDKTVTLSVTPSQSAICVGSTGDVYVTYTISIASDDDETPIPAFQFRLPASDEKLAKQVKLKDSDWYYWFNTDALKQKEGKGGGGGPYNEAGYAPDTGFVGVGGSDDGKGLTSVTVMTTVAKFDNSYTTGSYNLSSVITDFVAGGAKDDGGVNTANPFRKCTVAGAAVTVNPGATVSGTVKDSSGKAVSGATVELYKDGTKVATTTASGSSYSFSDVSTGTYTVKAKNSDGTLNGSAEITVKADSIPDAHVTVAKGFTVSGTIKSYGSASEAVTVTLLQGTSVIGSPQVLTGASGTVPYSQSYAFPTVPAGTYTLKVEKKGHAPWTESITVGDGNVAKDVTVYLWGDASGDGTTDGWDATLILRADAGISALDPNTAAASDVSGDGVIDGWDATLILRKDAGMISKFPVEEI